VFLFKEIVIPPIMTAVNISAIKIKLVAVVLPRSYVAKYRANIRGSDDA
jgi:hypothetical protein